MNISDFKYLYITNVENILDIKDKDVLTSCKDSKQS